MARIATDPNYSSPTFPRATAGTDLFLKEDVQALAAAMSTHVHDGSGKGLGVVPAAGSIAGSAITDGTITSAKILDGTIQTIDLGTNAATSQFWSNSPGSFPGSSASTTSTTFVDVPAPSSISFSCTGGPVLLLVMGSVYVGAGPLASVGLKLDGAGPQVVSRISMGGSGAFAVPFAIKAMWQPAAGTHVWQLAWSTSSGTLQMEAGSALLMYIVEFKR